MTTFAPPVVAWHGQQEDDRPLVVILHGRGSNETDIITLAEHLPDGLAYAAVRAPIAEGGGYAWFANRGIGRPVAESLAETLAWFRTWLDAIAPPERPVVLVGFSGGAAFAGGLALDDPDRYGGAAILSGTLPFDAGVPTTPGRLAGLPVLVAHGDADTVIPADLLARTWAYLHGEAGSTTTGVRDPGGHGISPAVLTDLQRWLRALTTTPEAAVVSARPFETGLFTFGEITADPTSGRPIDPAIRLREFIDLAVLADQAGLDMFGVGEHHRPDFAIASPPVVLAAIAQATESIRLTSTVTVLSTADPVKVFEDFTAVDLISDGRAEITTGRGAYTESFPLFGHDLADYDDLFDEKLGLLLQLNRDEHVTWTGRHRPPLRDAGIYPRPVQDQLPVWIAVGGTPTSVDRAGRLGLPLYLAILGHPAGFVDLADLYRHTGAAAGHELAELRVGVTSHFYVEATSQGARDTFYPYYSRYIGDNMPGARGRRLPRDAFDTWAAPRGALFAGSPQEIIDKILWEHELLGHDRFLAQIGLGGLPFDATARSIELLATEVLPVVRRETTPLTSMTPSAQPSETRLR